MTSLVSIRLNDALFKEMKSRAQVLHLTQTDYIRRAIEYMNRETEKQQRRKRLMRVSLRVRKNSLRINSEFSRIEDDSKI